MKFNLLINFFKNPTCPPKELGPMFKNVFSWFYFWFQFISKTVSFMVWFLCQFEQKDINLSLGHMNLNPWI
jgi:hypothetical protein